MINRRKLIKMGGLLILGSSATASLPLMSAWGGGRQQIGHHRGSISCDNGTVPLSDPANRLTGPADFGAADAVAVTRDSFEGPYFFCANPPGRAIASGKSGTPLTVAFRVIDTTSGLPVPGAVPGAVVDIWHCDARGVYSGYGADPDQPAATGHHLDPDNRQEFCRGALRTDGDGIAEFDTIWPGHYTGRAIHIHFKVHFGNRSWTTNQTLLPEDLNQRIVDTPSYTTGRATSRIPNAREAGWGLPTLTVRERDGRLIGSLNIGLKGA
ncbi:hypothetical protein [Magnetospira sp. QH-2]|uniref:hypothetical protein n=1 Tax=Magnetospira sp. (strain QH-2) TaxID=1288970 RepID=UPI0003E812F8|nr:hypothetical protein [Magnetospira sp. QH-2]CCQ74512.1 Hypothetical exported protein of unknown function [Magnetospira sp. QH-2]